MIATSYTKTSCFFSIVIATKNAEKHLQTCLDSLRGQSFYDFEIIIIDDLSIDTTAQIVQANRKLVKHFISEPDEGIYDAWNRGLNYTSGEWIIFLGSDDIMLPGTLLKYFNVLSKNMEVKFLSSKVEIKKIDSRFGREFGEEFNMSKMRKYMCVAHVGAVHHRSLFLEFGSFNISYKICGDYEFLLRLTERVQTTYIDEVTCIMLAGGASEKFPDALLEAQKAKISRGKRSRLEAIFDFCLASLKQGWRSLR